MISSSDKEFKDTKQIILGNKEMNPDFRRIADWIDETFSVKTINIIYDYLDNLKCPRIRICFEFSNEAKKFDTKEGFGYDPEKQKLISKKFKQLIEKQGSSKNNGFFGLFSDKKYLTDDVFVCYSAFEPIAKGEINESIPVERIHGLIKQINDTTLWEISRFSSATTFFLYTDDQLKTYENNGIIMEWSQKYFIILKEYDMFDYFKISEFTIYLDSKENFDNNFASNWYYYYK